MLYFGPILCPRSLFSLSSRVSRYFIKIFKEIHSLFTKVYGLRNGDLDVLLSAGGEVPASPHEVLLNALPAHGGQVHLGLLQPPPHALVAARDLEAAAEHLQHRPDVDVGQGVVLRPPPIHPGAARDVQMSS